MASQAVLELIMKLHGNAEASAGMHALGKDAGALGKSLDDIGSKGKGLKDAFSFAAGGLIQSGIQAISGSIGGLFSSMIEEATQAQAGMAQLDAVLASTGGKAGVTKEMVMGLADSLSASGGLSQASDDAVLAAENMLLTFTNIGGEVFPEATKTVLDMATAMNNGAAPSAEQLSKQAIQLGKALNDPVKGLTALRKVGVTFTEGQKEQIAAMVKMGNVAGAQKVVLAELATEFGGSAAKSAQTFTGKLITLTEQFNNVKQGIGEAMLPALDSIVSGLSSPAIMGAIQGFGEFIAKGIGKAIEFLSSPAVVGAISNVANMIGVVLTNAWNVLSAAAQVAGPIIAAIFAVLTSPAVTGTISFLADLLGTVLVGALHFISDNAGALAVVVGAVLVPSFVAWAISAGAAAAATLVAAAEMAIAFAPVIIAVGLIIAAAMALKAAWDWATSLFKSDAEKMAEAAEAAEKRITPAMQAAANSMIEGLKKGVVEGIDSVTKAVQAATNTMPKLKIDPAIAALLPADVQASINAAGTIPDIEIGWKLKAGAPGEGLDVKAIQDAIDAQGSTVFVEGQISPADVERYNTWVDSYEGMAGKHILLIPTDFNPPMESDFVGFNEEVAAKLKVIQVQAALVLAAGSLEAFKSSILGMFGSGGTGGGRPSRDGGGSTGMGAIDLVITVNPIFQLATAISGATSGVAGTMMGAISKLLGGTTGADGKITLPPTEIIFPAKLKIEWNSDSGGGLGKAPGLSSPLKTDGLLDTSGITGAINILVASVKTKMGVMVTDMGNAAKAGIGMFNVYFLAGGITAIASAGRIATSVTTALGTLAPAVGNAAKAAMALFNLYILSGGISAAAAAGRAATSAAAAVRGNFSPGALSAIGFTGMSAFATGVRGGGGLAIIAAVNAASGVKRAITGGLAPGPFVGVGFNLGNAVAQGIRASTGAAVAAASSMASQVAAAAKSALAIKSPSKVFEEIGKQTNAGMAAGLSQNQGVLATAESSITAVIAIAKRVVGKGTKDLMEAFSSITSAAGGAFDLVGKLGGKDFMAPTRGAVANYFKAVDWIISDTNALIKKYSLSLTKTRAELAGFAKTIVDTFLGPVDALSKLGDKDFTSPSMKVVEWYFRAIDAVMARTNNLLAKYSGMLSETRAQMAEFGGRIVVAFLSAIDGFTKMAATDWKAPAEGAILSFWNAMDWFMKEMDFRLLRWFGSYDETKANLAKYMGEAVNGILATVDSFAKLGDKDWLGPTQDAILSFWGSFDWFLKEMDFRLLRWFGSYDTTKANLAKAIGDSITGILGAVSGFDKLGDPKMLWPTQFAIDAFFITFDAFIPDLQFRILRWFGAFDAAKADLAKTVGDAVNGILGALTGFEKLADPKALFPTRFAMDAFFLTFDAFIPELQFRILRWLGAFDSAKAELSKAIGDSVNGILGAITGFGKLAEPGLLWPIQFAIDAFFITFDAFIPDLQFRILRWTGAFDKTKADLAKDIGDSVNGLIGALTGFLKLGDPKNLFPTQFAIEAFFLTLDQFLSAFEARAQEWLAKAPGVLAELAGKVGDIGVGLGKVFDPILKMKDAQAITGDQIEGAMANVWSALDQFNRVMTGGSQGTPFQGDWTVRAVAFAQSIGTIFTELQKALGVVASTSGDSGSGLGKLLTDLQAMWATVFGPATIEGTFLYAIFGKPSGMFNWMDANIPLYMAFSAGVWKGALLNLQQSIAAQMALMKVGLYNDAYEVGKALSQGIADGMAGIAGTGGGASFLPSAPVPVPVGAGGGQSMGSGGGHTFNVVVNATPGTDGKRVAADFVKTLSEELRFSAKLRNP